MNSKYKENTMTNKDRVLVIGGMLLSATSVIALIVYYF
mgnify:CR=1 FL=1|jgi:hypothetical protein